MTDTAPRVSTNRDDGCDVLVFGAGPAGCAAAITLCAAGARVIVAERSRAAHVRGGETLSPGALGVLDRLGLRARFLADGHLTCHANASAWGSADLVWHDFIRDPRGHAFHVDRDAFEALLRARAQALGTRFVTGCSARALSRNEAIWRVAREDGQRSISAGWVVDATGRAASVARHLGAQRVAAWTQVALLAFLRTSRPSTETFSLLEAVPEGFWYAAPMPDGRMALTLFSDAGALEAGAVRSPQRFHALLMAAPHVARRVATRGAVLDAALRVVVADSARLLPAHGPGWIAVGDAALAYDPIAAHGLTLALRTGTDAGEALIASTRGDREAVARYGVRLAAAYAAYEREALRLYASESRWPDAPFWRRRRALRASPPLQGALNGTPAVPLARA